MDSELKGVERVEDKIDAIYKWLAGHKNFHGEAEAELERNMAELAKDLAKTNMALDKLARVVFNDATCGDSVRDDGVIHDKGFPASDPVGPDYERGFANGEAIWRERAERAEAKIAGMAGEYSRGYAAGRTAGYNEAATKVERALVTHRGAVSEEYWKAVRGEAKDGTE